MPLVAAAIMPHGFSLIPELSEDATGCLKTRDAMTRVGDRFRDAGVESIVIAGPHGVRVDGAMAIVTTGRAAGSLSAGDRRVEMNVPIDRALADAIATDATAHDIPIARIGFGGNSESHSVAPMDWGTITPLWFTGHDHNRVGSGDVLADPPVGPDGPSVVIIVPSRSLKLDAQISFGRSIAKTCQQSDRRIGFIASCDWAHTHSASGPYGAHPTARTVDDTVRSAIRGNDLKSLQYLPMPDVSSAAIDGLWQTLILAGIHEVVPLSCDMMTYEICDYFSMIVAGYVIGTEP